MKALFAASLTIAAVLTIAGARAEGDAARGERLFNQQCKACHTVVKDAASPSGPNLHGLFGRKAGTGGGYESSEAMQKSGIVWDDKTLTDYLKNPKGVVPGTKMIFVGLKQEAQQEDMVAFLRKATQ